MKILAFDTTAKTATVSLTEDEKLIGVTVLDTPNTHSVTLLPMAQSLLKSADADIGDIELFVCSAGPGSFTGVRIGVATVKGLAYPEGKPCVGVSALEALAMNISCYDGVLCAVMDARRGQLYNALFECKNGSLTRLTPDRMVTSAELLSEIEAMGKKIYLSGDGYTIAKKALGDMAHDTPEILRYHNAYSVAVLGYRTYSAANEDERNSFTAEKLAPVYLRASQAERERNEKFAGN